MFDKFPRKQIPLCGLITDFFFHSEFQIKTFVLVAYSELHWFIDHMAISTLMKKYKKYNNSKISPKVKIFETLESETIKIDALNGTSIL